MKNTFSGLALLVAAAMGCATGTIPRKDYADAPMTRQRSYFMSRQHKEIDRKHEGIDIVTGSETIKAVEIFDFIQRYMLIDKQMVPYATLRLKCGECPVATGFVSVYHSEAVARSHAARLYKKTDYMRPVRITPETILEYVFGRYTSGRRIIPAPATSEEPQLKPL